MMNPAMPTRRDRRGFGIVAIDDPAAGAAFRIDTALIIDVAGLVLADLLAETPGMEARAQRLAVPPGEKLQQESLHPDPRGGSDRAVFLLMASGHREGKGFAAPRCKCFVR